MGLAGTALAGEDDRFAVVDPGALGERRDRRLRHRRVVVEAEVVEPLEVREAGVEQPASLSALRPFLHLGFEQRGQVGERRLLGSGRFGGERAEATADGRQVQLDGVCLDEGFERRGLRRGAHREPPCCSSSS
jgi:hypothetical protein